MLHFFLKKKKTWRYHYFKPVYQKSQWYYLQQALAYETCDCTQMPLHTPKTLETCKKSMPCLIKKASRCVIDRMSKTKNVVYLSLSIKHKDLTRKSCVFICYFIGSVVKIALHKTKDMTDFDRLKRNMYDGIVVFLASLLILLTWNILLFFFPSTLAVTS